MPFQVAGLELLGEGDNLWQTSLHEENDFP